MQQCGQLGQPVQGLFQGLLAPGEVQADEVVHRLPEKAGAGHRGDADLTDHPLTELQIAPALEAVQGQKVRDVQQDEIGPLGDVVLQPQPVQALQEHIPLPGVQRGQLLVIGLREADSHAGGLLKGGGGPDGEEIVDLFGVLNDLRRADEIAQPPAGDGVGLGQGAAGDGAVLHPGQAGHVDVVEGGKHDVLVYLVGDDVRVIPLGQGADVLQLLPGKDLSCGVGGIADDDGLGPLAEGVLRGEILAG